MTMPIIDTILNLSIFVYIGFLIWLALHGTN